MSKTGSIHMENLSPGRDEEEKAGPVLEHAVSGSDLAAIKDSGLQGFNVKLLLINLWSLLSPLGLGYSNAAIGSSTGQPRFYTYFDLKPTDPNLSNIFGSIFGMAGLGGVFGCLFVVLVQDRYGRRAGYLFSNSFLLLGAILGGASQNVAMLVVGRFFAGFGWANMLCAVVYQSEMAPTTIRGILGGSVGVAISVGYATAAWVSVGFFYYDGPNNWRLPLILAVVLPLFAICGLPFIPESPRWLALNGREDEALQVLMSVHSYHRDPQHLVARAEHAQITAQARLDKGLNASWLEMFKRYRYRTIVVMGIGFANQVSGIQVVVNYQAAIYGSLGLTGGSPLLVAGAWYIWCIMCECMWCYLIDIVGRRRLLWMGMTFCATQLCIMTALIAKYADNPTAPRPAQIVTVLWFFVYMLAYCSYEPTMFLYMAEIFPTHVRPKGMALALVAFNLTNFWTTYTQPVGTAHIGWKFYLVFICCTFASAVVAFVFVKETKGVPLEEMGNIFGDKEGTAITSKDRHQSNYTLNK